MNLSLFVSFLITTSATSVPRSVSFHKSVKADVREISPSETSQIHIQLVSILTNMGLETVDEDLVETIFISVVNMLRKSESLTSEEFIDQAINSSLFDDQSEISMAELFNVVADNISTMSEECRLRFQQGIRKRLENVSLSDQRMIIQMYSSTLTQLGF
jgi:hypothetical protein